MALSTGAIRASGIVHKWTSLGCTVFILFLCITGLPLIFHDDIAALSRPYATLPLSANERPVDFDTLVATATRQNSGYVPRFLFVDDEDPGAIRIALGRTADDESGGKLVVFDARSGIVLDAPRLGSGVMYVLLMLHAEMFAGLLGKLWLGFMGVLLLAAVLSGIVLYAPFMRRLEFASIRRHTPHLRWLDIHNTIGVVLVAWLTVVGVTGIINTWADLALKSWQAGQIAALTKPFGNESAVEPAQFSSLTSAVATAKAAMPSMRFAMLAFPGTAYATPRHYAVFMRGATPATERVLRPALIDAETGRLVTAKELPWYVKSVLIAQPLHFGDYGGFPLKVLWALLDLATIVMLATGVYLWLRKRAVVNPERAGWAQANGVEPRLRNAKSGEAS